MIECKFTLPYFDNKGNELYKIHNELRDVLIRRFGLLHRTNTISLWRDVKTSEMAYTAAFEYLITCEHKDMQDLSRIARVYGYKCSQDHLRVTYTPCKIEDMDLIDIKDDKNWQYLADQRLKDRQEANGPWPEKKAAQ